MAVGCPGSSDVRQRVLTIIRRLHPTLDRVTLTEEVAFTALGMDSVQATVLSGELAETFGISLTPTALFEHPTMARLCDHIARLLEVHSGE